MYNRWVALSEKFTRLTIPNHNETRVIMYIKAQITKLLVDFFDDDFRRIDHALAVLHFAEKIGKSYAGVDQELLVAVALLHDVGIKPSEEKWGYNTGKTQEEFGPAVAIELLQSSTFSKEKLIKVGDIIGNHHSVSRFDYIELEILKQADAKVNQLESSQ